MKNLLALAAFLVLLFIAIGYFRGWYLIESSVTQDGGNRVIIDFNSRKIKHDLDQGKEKLSNFLDSNKEKENDAAAGKQDPSLQQTNHTVVSKPQPGQTLPLQQSDDGGVVLPGQSPSGSQARQIPQDSWIFPQPQPQPQSQSPPQPWIFPQPEPPSQTNRSQNTGVWFAAPN